MDNVPGRILPLNDSGGKVSSSRRVLSIPDLRVHLRGWQRKWLIGAGRGEARRRRRGDAGEPEVKKTGGANKIEAPL